MTIVTKKALIKEFLNFVSGGMPMIHACAKIGVSRQTIYRWMKDSSSFSEKLEEAKKNGRLSKIADLEAEADRRAIEGILEPVYYKGKVCGAKRRYSDTLLIARLRALDPKRYGGSLDEKHPDSGDKIIVYQDGKTGALGKFVESWVGLISEEAKSISKDADNFEE